MMRRRADLSDSGAGSVLVVIAIALVVMLGSAVVVLLGESARLSRVQSAADIAAQAAAVALVRGGQQPCERARLAADAAVLQLATCEILGDTVTVEVVDPSPSRWWATARALARAGPAPPPLS